eukprot:scaffold17468_cov50-Prasinocladus_malaysianus.AAC.1
MSLPFCLESQSPNLLLFLFLLADFFVLIWNWKILRLSFGCVTASEIRNGQSSCSVSQVYVIRLLVLALTVVNDAVLGGNGGPECWGAPSTSTLGPSGDEQGSGLFGAVAPADVQPSGECRPPESNSRLAS